MVIALDILIHLPGCASGQTVAVMQRYQLGALPHAALPPVPGPPDVSESCASLAAEPVSTHSFIRVVMAQVVKS